MSALIDLLQSSALPLLFAVTLVERLGVPVPAGPLLVIAGGMAHDGRLGLAALLAVGLTASVLGDAVWYAAGRRLGARVLSLLCKISLSPDTCVRQSEELIGRWGGASLVLAKFLPGVSVVAAPVSGALGMPLRRFIAFELAGSLLWAAVWLGLGWLFADQIDGLLARLAGLGQVSLLVVGLALVAFIGQRLWRRRRAQCDAQIARISAAELQALLRAGAAPLLIDVRSDTGRTMDGRRIPGALETALDQLAAQAQALPRDRELIVFCACPNDVSAARGAALLRKQGFARARVLAGGVDAWWRAHQGEAGPPATNSPQTTCE